MDNESGLDTLRQRLDRLERESRRLKVTGAALLLALAVVGSMGQVLPKAVPKVVEAEQFVVREQNGNLRASLGVAGVASALTLFDQNGKLYATLGGRGDSTPHLELYAQTGPARASLGILDGRPALIHRNESGKLEATASLSIGWGGVPALMLDDQNGKLRAALSVQANGPSLDLFDEKENTRAVLGHAALESKTTGIVEQRPASSLVLFDKDGKVIWKAP